MQKKVKDIAISLIKNCTINIVIGLTVAVCMYHEETTVNDFLTNTAIASVTGGIGRRLPSGN